MNISRKPTEKIRQQGQKLSSGMIKYVDKILRDQNLYAMNRSRIRIKKIRRLRPELSN